MDYYNILGLEQNATTEQIKQCYRRLSLLTHPDRSLKNTDTQNIKFTFEQINEAYETLIDKEKREKYDSNNKSNNVIEYFKNTFTPGLNYLGNHNTNKINSYKPEPIVIKLSITLQQSYNGCKLPLEIVRVNDNIKERETIYLTIYEGIDNNELMILHEKGNIENNIKGDVKIFINLINNTHFQRKGLDLIYIKEISLKDALCGFLFNIQYIDERIIRIQNKKGTIVFPEYEKKIPNLGMKREGIYGELIIKFKIVFPYNLTSSQIESISQIL
tara:strand:+ start:11449 stop:12267 length:819 start_codon:yes stop_codon:yes gene_type:complete